MNGAVDLGRITTRTGEISWGQDHVHEDIGRAPDDGEGDGDCAGCEEAEINECKASHELLGHHCECDEVLTVDEYRLD